MPEATQPIAASTATLRPATTERPVATAPRKLRVMWLLNHGSARKFEVAMLKKIGIDEIFLSKRYPNHPSFRSASVDWSEDAHLSIPTEDLALLNAADWYGGATPQAWEVANRHFDLVFCILHQAQLLLELSKHFKGLVLWRVYGLQWPLDYDKVLAHLMPKGVLRQAIQQLGPRFHFAEAYPHLADSEPDYLRKARLYLPLGLADQPAKAPWQGSERKILFVCPDLAFNAFYAAIYKAFKKDFGDLPHVIAGAQPIKVDDEQVLGFVSAEEHLHNMTQCRVMYYHSDEPNHIHYHPFEAVRAGMPLVFMAGGMLDRMGGASLPGRCRTVAEARSKIEKILAGDQALIDAIRASQPVLLEAMRPANCEEAWQQGFNRLRKTLAQWRAEQAERPLSQRRKRIAVCLPIAYGGGSLRGAQLLAKALHLGSRQAGEAAEIVLLYPDVEQYRNEPFADCPKEIPRRAFSWRQLSAPEARRAMRYAGYPGWEPSVERYAVVDDGIRQLQDCDLWLFVSDRISIPLLPLKPVVLMVYDYLQRYEALMHPGGDLPFLSQARAAERVLVTTRFSAQDAVQYAGVEPQRLRQMPMLFPEFTAPSTDLPRKAGSYFLWTTNAALHKNHQHAAEALEIYYDELDGQLDCWVTGEDSEHLLASGLPHLQAMAAVFQRSKVMRKRVKWKGRLAEARYRRSLAGARFLWHPARLDNGTFSVVEAAQLGVPALSSDYPAMREMEAQLALGLSWMDANNPRQMAERLKHMEEHADAHRAQLPDGETFAAQRVEALAGVYWQEIRECL